MSVHFFNCILHNFVINIPINASLVATSPAREFVNLSDMFISLGLLHRFIKQEQPALK